MDEVKTGSHSINLSPTELDSIEQYRRLKDTSVLVILFTDIKGFTQLTENQGESYSQMVRRLHDEILVGTIEENRTGLVIKHIGDSVMAVFSEPSTAVSKALLIQEKIRLFNEAHPELENIQVRIGLHMGQVAIENQTHLDLFGRHVNRAARVESLADGGQIYLTYPVFDSAKGWLSRSDNPNLAWKLHGRFFLKGIDEPVEIYEVYDHRYLEPHPPRKARKKRAWLPIVAALSLLLTGVGLMLALNGIKRTEVWFVNWPSEKIMLDQTTELVLAGDPGQSARKSLTKISIGDHVFHYDIHWQVKYYMEAVIKRGKNYLHPQFVENFLPTLSRRLDYTRENPSLQAQETFTYRLYDPANHRSDNQAIVSLSVQGIPMPRDPDHMTFELAWTIDLNGKTISQDRLSIPHRLSSEDQKQTKILYTDDSHYWELRYFISQTSAELTLSAAYREYQDK